MALVEVDVIDIQPAGEAWQCSMMCFRERPWSLGPSSMGKVHLRGEHVVVTREGLQRTAGDLLGGAAAVDVRRVEEVDPRLERAVNARDSALVSRAAVGQPGLRPTSETFTPQAPSLR